MTKGEVIGKMLLGEMPFTEMLEPDFSQAAIKFQTASQIIAEAYGMANSFPMEVKNDSIRINA